MNQNYLVAAYINPADPSDPTQPPVGNVSYAGNAMVLLPGAKFTTTFQDGASNTIVFAEHYATCGGTDYFWLTGGDDEFYAWVGAQKKPPINWTTFPQRRPTFADRFFGDVYPQTQGQTSRGSVPGLTFQVAPKLSECDRRMAQTPHRAGMLATLGDGSVRTLAPGMSEATYWAAVTPAGGEVLGNDW
jgi:hypothetical protein